MATSAGGLDWGMVEAVLFDLDGVITPTAEVHKHAWAEMFTPFLDGQGVDPYTEQDYFAHVDGKPHTETVSGVSSGPPHGTSRPREASSAATPS